MPNGRAGCTATVLETVSENRTCDVAAGLQESLHAVLRAPSLLALCVVRRGRFDVATRLVGVVVRRVAISDRAANEFIS